ncbi:hypothetical protein SAMN05421866_0012 [Chryseobacterium oranimense]|uniref:Uncharacterized protein n=1 Tax=Chryseobacterium oranimense TaxID=421058 RepID=A0A1M5X8M9_9FLAO|nr:hypothetical protein SAMN05421866_0012 [Chryseobacterium oranimense]
MSISTIVQLNEKELLDLICKEYKLNRSKAFININYVEDDPWNGGSWTVQVQAPQEPAKSISQVPINLTIQLDEY